MLLKINFIRPVYYDSFWARLVAPYTKNTDIKIYQRKNIKLELKFEFEDEQLPDV